MSEEVKEESQLEDQNTIEVAVAQFFGMSNAISKSAISQKGFKRAFLYAAHKGLTEKGQAIKLKSDEEKKLAMAFGVMLDSRLIMMAHAAKNFKENQEQKEEDKGEEQNV